jgi:HSP20 family protein
MRTSRLQRFSLGWDPLQQFQHEINWLFDRWGRDGQGAAGFPAVNMWEDADNVFLEAELPGMNLKDLEIYVTGGNQLTLKGERKPSTPEGGVWHRQERGFGRFSRTVALPFAVDADRVDAHFENSVLRVQLAKHESAKPRQIAVTAG